MRVRIPPRVLHFSAFSLLVTWTPSQGPDVTGYTIYYQKQDGGPSGSVKAGQSDTSITIPGLIVGATYSISIVANSSTLPSTVTTGPSATIGTFHQTLCHYTLCNGPKYTTCTFPDITEPATISLTPSSPTVVAGDSVTLTCSISLPSGVTGTPVFEWEGPGVTDDPTSSGGVVSSILTLTSVSTSEAELYSCTASLRGEISTNTIITVQSKVFCSHQIQHSSVHFSSVPTPTPFITHPILTAGTSGTLTCGYTLSTPLDVTASATWTVNGSAVTGDERISTDRLSLTLSPLTTSDSGTYTCTLTIISLKPYVTVLGPQQSPPKEVYVYSKTYYCSHVLTCCEFNLLLGAHPVEDFKKTAVSESSLSFSWSQPSIAGNLTTGYNLTPPVSPAGPNCHLSHCGWTQIWSPLQLLNLHHH